MDNLINLKNVTNEMDGLFDVPPVWLDLLLSVCGMVLGLLVAILGRYRTPIPLLAAVKHVHMVLPHACPSPNDPSPPFRSAPPSGS